MRTFNKKKAKSKYNPKSFYKARLFDSIPVIAKKKNWHWVIYYNSSDLWFDDQPVDQYKYYIQKYGMTMIGLS